MPKNTVIAEPTKMKPSLSVSADDIKNIEDYGLNDNVTITAKGKIKRIASYDTGKEENQDMSIELSDIKVEKGKSSDSEDESTADLIKARAE